MTDLGSVPLEVREIPRLYAELEGVGARVEGRRVPWRFGKPSPEELIVLAAQASRQEPRLLWAPPASSSPSATRCADSSRSRRASGT
ncbi:MAG: hypothetical protein H6Q88_3502 [Anaeromyxobacteraceae bacterium]|nr:hypothetical protein [Anaeromyxobacteraceae bacterium]